MIRSTHGRRTADGKWLRLMFHRMLIGKCTRSEVHRSLSEARDLIKSGGGDGYLEESCSYVEAGFSVLDCGTSAKDTKDYLRRMDRENQAIPIYSFRGNESREDLIRMYWGKSRPTMRRLGIPLDTFLKWGAESTERLSKIRCAT